MPGCGPTLPIWELRASPRRSDVRTFLRVSKLSPLFSYSCKLFCTCQELNSFVFKQFRTLCQKTPGGGGSKLLTRSLPKDFSSGRPSKMGRSYLPPLSCLFAAVSSRHLLPAGSILWVVL